MQSIRKISTGLFGSFSNRQPQQPQQTKIGKKKLQIEDEAHLQQQQFELGHQLNSTHINRTVSTKHDHSIQIQQQQQQPAAADKKLLVQEKEEIDAMMEKMSLENQRLKLDIGRLEQKLSAMSANDKTTETMRLTCDALQVQIKLLVEEVVYAWSLNQREFQRRYSTADIEKIRTRSDQLMDMQNKFIRSLQLELESSIRTLLENGKVEPAWRVILNARGELRNGGRSRNMSTQTTNTNTNTTTTTQITKKHIPKRIMYRPCQIQIPMVRIHDARIQEIELLRSRRDRKNDRHAQI